MKQLQSNATLIGPGDSTIVSGIDSGAIHRNRARGPGILIAAVALVVVFSIGALVYSVLSEGAGGKKGLQVGAMFQNEHELLAIVPGHVIMGSFHVKWPARITHIAEGADGVQFQVNGTPHSYGDFPGRTFLAINFKIAGQQEMVIVLATKP